MADPNYQHRPLTDQQRQRQSEAQRQRLGIPEGHVRVYGVHVPSDVAWGLRPVAADIARRQNFEAANAFVLEAQSNGWRYDASKPEPKPVAAGWSEERRKAASERSKAHWAKRRAEQQARWERQQQSPGYKLRDRLFRLRRENHEIAARWHANKAKITELEEAEKHLDAALATLRRYGIVEHD